MTTTILASTGIVTREPGQTDHRAILENAPKLGAAAFELQLQQAWYGHLDDVVEELRASELSFPVVHAAKAIGAGLGSDDQEDVDEALAALEVNCRAAAALGAQTLVLHLWEDPTSDERIDLNLARLPACLDTAEAYGVVLGLETVQGRAGTPLANLRLATELDGRARVTLDTEFLGFYGQLAESVAADWLWEQNRVRHVHLKDFDGRLRDASGRRYLIPGEGTLDLQGFLNGLAERGYQGAITVEASAVRDDGALDESRIEQISAIVRQLSGS
jgi:sugar phosphate isomerase/epimerase